MSTGLECQFIEPKPGEWYYILENGNAPKQTWDWREYATAYGPFKSEAWANRHLCDCHPNPGGAEYVPHDIYRPNPVLERLIAEAPEATAIANKMRWPWLRPGDDPYEGIDEPVEDA